MDAEQIYLICNKNFKLAKGANKYTDVWEIKQEMKNPHPAPFPEELTDRIVSSTTGKIILDPFGGSGTTMIAAEQLDRRAYLMELDEVFCDVIVKRWENFTGLTAIMEE